MLPSYGYLLLLASLFAFGSYFFTIRKERAKKNWPSAAGKVIGDSSIVRTTKAILETPTVSVSNKDDRHYTYEEVWALRVEYEYEVAGQKYTGRRATATDHVDFLSDYPNAPNPQMVEWSARLPKGAAVSVHYDPSEPTESYIIYTESTAALSTILKTAAALMFLGIALVLAPRIF